ncbi:MAG TPA: GGDEF domain-containing response regulator [Gammaproteobacteria bacterium]|nr:GGDEF domain-containing response regulator [Gammaproteobacteria bacterium]
MSETIKILIVDDSEDDALLVERELRRGGLDADCKRVDSAITMSDAIMSQSWDVVVTDHNMPGFSSQEALGIVKQYAMDVPFIIVSGSIGEDIAVEAMKAGAHDYIMKDNLTRLMPAIERELREADIRRARRRAEETVQHLAYHDALTGLVNRAEFEYRLKKVFMRCRDEKAIAALLYMDLDQFKIVNDTCGHLAGDQLLCQIASLLKSKLRKVDTLARIGGDEFGILLENCTTESALSVASSLTEVVDDFRFVWRDHTFRIGVSIGMVPIDANSASPTSVLSAADAACYAAKESGRNRVHVYTEHDSELAKRQGEMQWVEKISLAVEQNRFVLYRQPIKSLSDTDEAMHYELLLRMYSPDGQIILPGAFIPAAERYNMMSVIDNWVLHTAMTWLALHAQEIKDSGSFYTINLSGSTLGDEQTLSYILTMIEDNGSPADRICFEITETAAIANFSNALNFINTLKHKGCRFALDDFGSGLSSFAYLKNLPVDYLKIDGSFVRDITFDKTDKAIVKSIIEIGHTLGLKTIAEFVENEDILALLEEMGVDYVQGYAIGKPEPHINTEVATHLFERKLDTAN